MKKNHACAVAELLLHLSVSGEKNNGRKHVQVDLNLFPLRRALSNCVKNGRKCT
jgi:hypothetical protein